jgi:hypothetical protein
MKSEVLELSKNIMHNNLVQTHALVQSVIVVWKTDNKKTKQLLCNTLIIVGFLLLLLVFSKHH